MALRTKFDELPIELGKQLMTKMAYKSIGGITNAAELIRYAKDNYVDLIEKMTDIRVSQLGTPILDHLTFYTDGYKDTTGSFVRLNEGILNSKRAEVGEEMDYIGNRFKQEMDMLKKVFSGTDEGGIAAYSVLIDNLFITVNKAPHIVETYVKGDKGSFKQYINEGDYTISIKGQIAGSNQFQTDVDKIRKIKTLLSLGTLKVSSIYLNNVYDILDVCVTDFSFDQDTKFANITNFTINMKSDSVSYDFITETDEPTSITPQ